MDDDWDTVNKVLVDIGVDYLQPYQKTLLERIVAGEWPRRESNPSEERFRFQDF